MSELRKKIGNKRPRDDDASESSTTPGAASSSDGAELSPSVAQIKVLGNRSLLLHTMIPFLTNQEASQLTVDRQHERSFANKLRFACVSSPSLLEKIRALVRDRARESMPTKLEKLSIRIDVEDMMNGDAAHALKLVADAFRSLTYLEICSFQTTQRDPMDMEAFHRIKYRRLAVEEKLERWEQRANHLYYDIEPHIKQAVDAHINAIKVELLTSWSALYASGDMFANLESLSIVLNPPPISRSQDELDVVRAHEIFANYMTKHFLASVSRAQLNAPTISHFCYSGAVFEQVEIVRFVHPQRWNLVSLRIPLGMLDAVLYATDTTQRALAVKHASVAEENAAWVAYPCLRFLRTFETITDNYYSRDKTIVSWERLSQTCPALEVLWVNSDDLLSNSNARYVDGVLELEHRDRHSLPLPADDSEGAMVFPRLRVLVFDDEQVRVGHPRIAMNAMYFPALEEFYILGYESIVRWPSVVENEQACVFNNLRILVDRSKRSRLFGKDFFNGDRFPILPRAEQVQLSPRNPNREPTTLATNNAMRLPDEAVVYVSSDSLQKPSRFVGSGMYTFDEKKLGVWLDGINAFLVANRLSLISPCGSCAKPSSGMFNTAQYSAAAAAAPASTSSPSAKRTRRSGGS